MSTFRQVSKYCSVCGSRVETFEYSTNQFGSPDLDLRPPPMERDTMPLWIQKCPSCGYTARDISVYKNEDVPHGLFRFLKKPKDNKETDRAYLASEEYIHCEGLPITSPQCKRFYQYYLLGKKHRIIHEQIAGLLYAIWTCDDEGETELAKSLRRKAVQILDTVSSDNDMEQERNLLLRADLLRRSGQFQKLSDEYRDVSFKVEINRKILRFELLCAQKRDSDCYTVKQALDRLS